jgi:hypothetical protein
MAKRVRPEIVTPDPSTDITESRASRILFVDMEVVQPLPSATQGTLKATVRDSESGEPVAETVVFELQIHSDEWGSDPLSTDALYDVATTGTVLYPALSGAPVVKVKSNANGYVEIPVNKFTSGTIWCVSDRSSKSPALNCTVSKSMTFTV